MSRIVSKKARFARRRHLLVITPPLQQEHIARTLARDATPAADATPADSLRAPDATPAAARNWAVFGSIWCGDTRTTEAGTIGHSSRYGAALQRPLEPATTRARSTRWPSSVAVAQGASFQCARRTCCLRQQQRGPATAMRQRARCSAEVTLNPTLSPTRPEPDLEPNSYLSSTLGPTQP